MDCNVEGGCTLNWCVQEECEDDMECMYSWIGVCRGCAYG